MRQHCCEDMRATVEDRCDRHQNPFHCPDYLVHYSASQGMYGLVIHDRGESFIGIRHCPWCGAALPHPGGGDPTWLTRRDNDS